MKHPNRGIAWYGGKTHMLDTLLSLLPDTYTTFVEVFGGGAALLLHENKSKIKVYNDIDEELVNVFKVIQDKDMFNRFFLEINMTLYSKVNFVRYKKSYKNIEDRVRRAVYFYFIAISSVNHTTYGFSKVHDRVSCGMPDSVAKYRSILGRLENMHNALQGVILENDSFENIIAKYDAEDTLFYIDPPYIPCTRSKKYLYRKEMRLEQHYLLVDILRSVRGKVMLSGFQNALYDTLGWKKVEVNSKKSSTVIKNASNRINKTEVVWINY